MFGGYRKNAYLCSTRTPKPLYNAQIGGRFFICTMAVNFEKSYTSPESIIGILYERGLNIDDQSLAVDILKNVGYYRLSAKEWMDKTRAIGIISKAGRYGGTYAHKDIAFEFAMWINPNFNPLEFDGIKKTMC